MRRERGEEEDNKWKNEGKGKGKGNVGKKRKDVNGENMKRGKTGKRRERR